MAKSRANQRNRSKARAKARTELAAPADRAEAKPSPSRVGVRRVQARYDSAQTTADNRRHWAAADHLSPNAATSEPVRRSIRSRARYEVANNSYAKGIVLTLANDVVGPGPRPDIQTNNDDDGQRVEAAFEAWASEIDLAAKLRLMRSARAESGEVFGLLATNPMLDSPVKLDLRLIEADQVGSPFTQIEGRLYDGIEVDQYGNRLWYYVAKDHPGETTTLTLGTFDYDRVPASSVIHYYRADRPGQLRGVPDITPALPLFAQLRRFTLATIAAAETAADFAAVIYSDAPSEGGVTEVDPLDTVELEQRMATTLPAGWKLGQIKAEHPTTTFTEFSNRILNEIARCLNMPFNVAAGNSSSYNYASGRLDHQTYFKAIAVDRREMEQTILRRVFREWLSEAALIEGLLPQSMRARSPIYRLSWFWPGFEHVDPQKEANAQHTRLEALTTTLKDEYARVGKDWKSQLRQIAAEQNEIAALGIKRATDQAQPEAAEPAQEVEDD